MARQKLMKSSGIMFIFAHFPFATHMYVEGLLIAFLLSCLLFTCFSFSRIVDFQQA
jgi:hypothetical protein